MENVCGYPYFELAYSKQAIHDRDGFDELLTEVSAGEPVEVVVLVHGWSNDMTEARALYHELIDRLRTVADTSPPPGLGDRRLAFLGVLWPSKRFADRALIPGGAASRGGTPSDADLEESLAGLEGVFETEHADDLLRRAKALVPELDDSGAARDAFVELVRDAVGRVGEADEDADAREVFKTLSGNELLTHLKAPVLDRTPSSDGRAAGGAYGARAHDDEAMALGLSLTGFKAAAQRFLNVTTYYEMKQRAGTIGAYRLTLALNELRARSSRLRLHLVGHSFGGRLVTAATVGLPSGTTPEPDSVTLLQAAFSHYGFAADYRDGRDGHFRTMVSDRMTRGPILVTHSRADRAVGYAYPLASRLADDDAAGLGGAKSRFGGIGRNGAQKTPEAIDGTLHEAGDAYDFAAGSVYNLEADRLILSHGAVRTPEVAYAILSAIAVSTPDP
jgi:hypothetical protein